MPAMETTASMAMTTRVIDRTDQFLLSTISYDMVKGSVLDFVTLSAFFNRSVNLYFCGESNYSWPDQFLNVICHDLLKGES